MLMGIRWLAAGLLLLVALLARAQTPDVAGAKDHPLFARPAGFVIAQYSKEKTTVQKPGSQKSHDVDGIRTTINYREVRSAVSLTRNELEQHFLEQMATLGQSFESVPAKTTYTLKNTYRGKPLWLQLSDFQLARNSNRVTAFRIMVVEEAE